MEVEYSLKPDDLLALLRARQRKNTRPAGGWLWTLLFGLLVLLYFLADAAPPFMPAGFLPGWGVGVTCGLAIFLLFAVLVRRSQQKVLKDARNQWLFATRRITLAPEEFSITSWFSRFTYRWEVVSDIGVTPGHVFLFITSTDASVVPRRAFRDQQHFKEFVALARRYREAAAPPAGVRDALPAEAPRRPTTITRDPE